MPRRLLIAAAVAFFIIGGWYAALSLPFVWLPPHTGVRLQVVWQDPGAAVPRIAEAVAKPLVQALGSLDGLEELSVTVSTGRVQVTLDFEARARNPLAAVRQRLGRATFPAGSEPVRVIQQGEVPEAILVVSARGPAGPALTRWTLDVLSPSLRGLKSVAMLAVEGVAETQIIALADQRRLAGAGLAPEDVIHVLGAAYRGATEATHKPSEQTARLAALPLRLPSGEITALGEFTRFDTREERAVQVLYDGAEALRILVQGAPGGSERKLAEAVGSQLGWLRANGQIPDGLDVVSVEELRATRVQARRSLQRAMVIGALGALALFFVITGSLRALTGRVMLLLSVWGAVLLALWIGSVPLSVPTLGGVALAVGPVVALSYLRRVRARRGTSKRSPNGVLVTALGTLMVLVPWLFATGTVWDHYQGLLLTFACSLGFGIVVDRLWSGTGRRRRAAESHWRSRSGAWLVAAIERWSRVIASRPWLARMLLLVSLVSALLASITLVYRDVPLDAYRPLVLEWTVESPGVGAIAREDERLMVVLAGETGVRHRELTYLDPSRTFAGRALVRTRLFVDPGSDDPAWRARLLQRMAGAGLKGLRLVSDSDARETNGLQVIVHTTEWPALLELAGQVLERAGVVRGVERVDGGMEPLERYVLHSDGPLAAGTLLSESQIDRALALAEGDLVLGEWSHPAGSAQLRVRVDPRPQPPGRILLVGDRAGEPARYLSDFGEPVRELAPRWLRLDEDGFVTQLEVIPDPRADPRRLAEELAQTLDRIALAPGQEIAVSGRDDVTAALGPAWRVGLLATLAIGLVVAWGRWRGGALMSAMREALVAAVATLVTAALMGVAAAGLSAPVAVGLALVFGLTVAQGAVLGGDPGGNSRRLFGRRVLDAVAMTIIVIAGVSPLAMLSGAAGALLAPLAQVLSAGVLVAMVANWLFLAAFPVPASRRHAR